jgi:GNAT superfamily N-acetyltransferase
LPRLTDETLLLHQAVQPSDARLVSKTQMDSYSWVRDTSSVNLDELSHLYRIAPLGEKPPEALAIVFGNSMHACFVYRDDALVGAGRALADGLDCAYIADVAVHPEHQGRGLGTAIIRDLMGRCKDHRKIILYANPGTEEFYARLGFLRMNTAMGLWQDPTHAIETGLLRAAEEGDQRGHT